MNKACSIIIIATVFAGVALGIQSASTDADSFSVGPPERIEEGPASQAGLLGMAEYYCHWNRFHAAVMIMFTDAAIELGEHVDAMREISPPDELESLVLEFNESNWKEYGKKLGGIGLANGLDSSIDWMIFGQSAGGQLLQYVLAGNNNWPAFGNRIADQAVSLAHRGHDIKWTAFSRSLGESIGRGTPQEWNQWGLQLALQARSMAGLPSVDWNRFAKDVAQQAQWLSRSMSSREDRP